MENVNFFTRMEILVQIFTPKPRKFFLTKSIFFLQNAEIIIFDHLFSFLVKTTLADGSTSLSLLVTLESALFASVVKFHLPLPKILSKAASPSFIRQLLHVLSGNLRGKLSLIWFDINSQLKYG